MRVRVIPAEAGSHFISRSIFVRSIKMVKSFDRVADIYDETRRMPPDVLAQVVDQVASVVDPADGEILEIGIGTGRIAIPLAERGFRIAGVDISEKMLGHLREKMAAAHVNVSVARGDVTILPFANTSFSAVLAVHVFHLLDDMRACVAEVRRVLKQAGCLLFSGEQRTQSYIQQVLSERYGMKDGLSEIFASAGVQMPNWGDVEHRVEQAVSELGGTVSQLGPTEWDSEITCAGVVDRIEGRVTSSLWNVPDETLRSLVEKVRLLLEHYVGSPSTVIRFRRRFDMFCARF